MNLVCVDPKQVHEFWPFCSSMIKAAMKRCRITDYSTVEHSIRNGNGLLWLAWDQDARKIMGAAVTQLSSANGEKFCTIVAGGSVGGRDEWLPLIAGIEKFARTEGCVAMRILGRRGWARLLPAYKVSSVLLERTL